MSIEIIDSILKYFDSVGYKTDPKEAESAISNTMKVCGTGKVIIYTLILLLISEKEKIDQNDELVKYISLNKEMIQKIILSLEKIQLAVEAIA
jgi:hypothetical protein